MLPIWAIFTGFYKNAAIFNFQNISYESLIMDRAGSGYES